MDEQEQEPVAAADAFELVCEIFRYSSRCEPLQLEILPMKELCDIVRDGQCVGIPKSLLLTAVLHILSTGSLEENLNPFSLNVCIADCLFSKKPTLICLRVQKRLLFCF